MTSKIIIDANVILDLILERSADINDLKIIYKAVEESKFRCYTTTSIVHICGHWLKKSLDVNTTKKLLLSYLNKAMIIDGSHSIVINALFSDMPDMEYALQYYIAIHHNLDCFISRDKQFARHSKPQLPVYNPSAFIKKFMS